VVDQLINLRHEHVLHHRPLALDRQHPARLIACRHPGSRLGSVPSGRGGTPEGDLDVVTQVLCFADGLEFLERLVLDLADALARDVECVQGCSVPRP